VSALRRHRFAGRGLAHHPSRLPGTSSTFTAIRSSRASQDKARTLAQILTKHQLKSRLFPVPFGSIQ
jgi:hypothetical protein